MKIAIALKMAIETANKPPAAKETITNFVQQLKSDTDVAPGRGHSVKVGDILKTGLGVLLRFLAPIP